MSYVSIILPVYNATRSLRKSVDSVHAQVFQDWELVLVDDGSTDGSSELCDKLATEDTRVRVIHKPNGGVSSARNAGIDAATGKYITFCDSDDYLEPDYLETLVQTAKSNPDCGHIWCCFQTVTGYQKENAAPNYISEESVLYYTLKDYMTLHEMWLDTGPWNKLYAAKIIKESGLYFPIDLSLGEDWLFNLAYIDASANEKIAVVTKPLYNYVRGNNDSLDSKYRQDLLDIYRRLNAECLAYLERWGVPQAQIEKLYDSRFYMYEKVLRNTMRAPNMSRREKRKWNSTFMRSKEFQEALNTRKCFVHPLYLSAYRSGSFINVLLADFLCKAKNALMFRRK